MHSHRILSYCVFIPASTLKPIHERRGSSCRELLGVNSTLKFAVESMVHPLKSVYCVTKDCDMNRKSQYNERASFIIGHWIYGDCILASYYNNNGYMGNFRINDYDNLWCHHSKQSHMLRSSYINTIMNCSSVKNININPSINVDITNNSQDNGRYETEFPTLSSYYQDELNKEYDIMLKTYNRTTDSSSSYEHQLVQEVSINPPTTLNISSLPTQYKNTRYTI